MLDIGMTDTFDSLDDREIYIVGPLKLQNELIASFLKQTIGANCRIFEAFQEVPALADEENVHSRLTLLDCLGKDVETCIEELESSNKHISGEDFVCLFNVRPKCGIEQQTIMRGIRGFFYQEDPFETLAKGAKAVFEGELWISRKILSDYIFTKDYNKTFSSNTPELSLTTREEEILRNIAFGLKNRDIAEKLNISRHTVKTHVYHMFKKLKVPNRLQAALWAARNLS